VELNCYNKLVFKSLPFVHTARRYYRLDCFVRSSDRPPPESATTPLGAEKTIKLEYLEEVKSQPPGNDLNVNDIYSIKEF